MSNERALKPMHPAFTGTVHRSESPYRVFFCYKNFFDIGIGIEKCSNISTYSTRYYIVGHPIIVDT